jgi:hypothetical protein
MRRKCDAGLVACRQTGQADRRFGREREPCGCGEARMLAAGVVLQASAGASGPTGAFGEIHRGAPSDPRGSSANLLTSEFLGDYVLCRGDPDLRRGSLERHPQRRGLRRHQQLPPSAAERAVRHPTRRGAAVPAQLRQLRHLQLHNRVSRHQPAPVPEHPATHDITQRRSPPLAVSGPETPLDPHAPHSPAATARAVCSGRAGDGR